MAKADTPSHESFKAAVQWFIQNRLQTKLGELKDDDPKREEERKRHQPVVWIEDAVQRVEKIQIATHSLKPIHSQAKGTNLYVKPSDLFVLDELGSHALGNDFEPDVIGDAKYLSKVNVAAARDLHQLLKLQVCGRSLLAALQEKDPSAMQALHDDTERAKTWCDALVDLTQPRSNERASSHTLAKQLYWLTGGDATDGDYELLAPLFPASLVHRVYTDVKDALSGAANKAAREARRKSKTHDGVLVDYPGLAMQKMGGTKPLNISQLNSEHGGKNYLLASLPPIWQVSDQPLPLNVDSVFKHLYPQRPEVKSTVRDLLHFLEKKPPQNKTTRECLAVYVEALVEELVNLAGQLQRGLPAGWTRDDERFHQLAPVEQLWLDPLRAELPGEDDFADEWLRLDWPDEIFERFGNWLNAQFKVKGKPVGDIEARAWQRALREYDDWRETLKEQRRRIHKQGGQQ